MFSDITSVVFLCLFGTTYAHLKGTLPVHQAVDKKDNGPLIFTLDKNGVLHAVHKPVHAITAFQERMKLNNSRRKRPLNEILDEGRRQKLGVRPNIYGGEAISMVGDTAVPNVPVADGTDSDFHGYQTGIAGGLRNKRQVGGYHEVDLLLVFDYALYLFWLERNGFNASLARDEIMDYYANIVNAANVRYATMDSGNFRVRLSVSGFIIAETPEASPWTQLFNVSNTVDAIAAINAFNAYINSKRALLPAHNHAVTITRFDLSRGNSTSLVGLANQNRTCTAESVSILEELRSQETATLLAHEVAHSLGANHDGDGNLCSNNDTFVMSTRISVPTRENAHNPFTFSRCSPVSINEYLTFRTNGCTLIRNKVNQRKEDLTPFLQEEFGQKYPHDVQCEIYRGNGSKFCRSLYGEGSMFPFADLCFSLYCLDPADQLCYPTLAHDGTSCGNQQWCRSGVCMSSLQAPATPANCPAGNDPVADCMPSVCTSADANDTCCATCRPILPSTPVPPTTVRPPVKPRPPFRPQKPFPVPKPFSFDNFFSFGLFNENPFNFQNQFEPFPPNSRPNRPNRPNGSSRPNPPTRPQNKPATGFHPGSSNYGFNTFGSLQKEMDSIFGGFNDFSFSFGKK